ncbi:MAG: hypothetical protein GY820_38935 [Gammaproteobacteria bacterium]|nr:hypothetical protein [Gammaproteobacteria bacterium]
MKYFDKISTLNSVDDPVDIGYDQETGVSEAQVIVDCITTDKGRPGRAPGFTQAESGNFHSVFCDGGDCFVGKGTALYQVGTDKSIRGVRSSLSGDRISFCQVGPWTFYTINELYNGRITAGASEAWPTDTHTGPTTNALITTAPKGKHLAYNHGRIFVVVGSSVFWNHEPGKYGLYIMDEDYWQFGSDVLMIAPVKGGMFVSTRTQTFFMSGRNPKNAREDLVADHPAYEWSMATQMVEGEDIGYEPGLCRLWVSPEGLICGTVSGQHKNINKENVIYPETGEYGACGLVGYHLYNAIK